MAVGVPLPLYEKAMGTVISLCSVCTAAGQFMSRVYTDGPAVAFVMAVTPGPLT